MIGYGVAGLVGLAVLAGIVAIIVSAASKNDSGEAHIDQSSGSTNGVQPDERSGTTSPAPKVTNLQEAAKKAGCDLRLHLPEEGHNHIPPTAATPEYKTNPPTSGNHVEPPYQQADGAYKEMPQEIDFVHSMEHGRLEIQYSPSLSESAQLELIGLYDTMYGATLLFPNDKHALRSRGDHLAQPARLQRIQGRDHARRDPRLRQADLGHYGREPVTGFPFTGPTPEEPTIN